MKRLRRAFGVIAVPVLVTVVLVTVGLSLAGCSSSNDAAVSTAISSSSAWPSPTTSAKPTPKPTGKPTPKPVPPATVDPLTGGTVVKGPVIAAKLDNTSAGLPQYGVTHADIVYVEQVEGGLTRLMAVFHSALPTEVGNVRSVRSTDAELLPVFGTPALVFSGGAGGPVAALAATSTVAVSEDSGAAGFWRSDASSSPYNLHANLQAIAAGTPGLTQPGSIGFDFARSDPRIKAAPAATAIDVRFQAANVGFAWTDGRYRVTRDGSEQSDATGHPIVADNVLLQNIDLQPDGVVDSVGSPSFISHTVGSGSFTLYRDGHAISGTWSRPAPDKPTAYRDAAGKPVPFKPGETWVALVPPVASVSTS